MAHSPSSRSSMGSANADALHQSVKTVTISEVEYDYLVSSLPSNKLLSFWRANYASMYQVQTAYQFGRDL